MDVSQRRCLSAHVFLCCVHTLIMSEKVLHLQLLCRGAGLFVCSLDLFALKHEHVTCALFRTFNVRDSTFQYFILRKDTEGTETVILCSHAHFLGTKYAVPNAHRVINSKVLPST